MGTLNNFKTFNEDKDILKEFIALIKSVNKNDYYFQFVIEKLELYENNLEAKSKLIKPQEELIKGIMQHNIELFSKLENDTEEIIRL